VKTIAVEPGLSNVRQYLESKGFQCVDIRDGQPQGQAAVIVQTGADKNLMGMQDVVHDVPCISAAGLTPEQVYERVRQVLQ
jgi:hypothetical protein